MCAGELIFKEEAIFFLYYVYYYYYYYEERDVFLPPRYIICVCVCGDVVSFFFSV